jgi:hypothetical protein
VQLLHFLAGYAGRLAKKRIADSHLAISGIDVEAEVVLGEMHIVFLKESTKDACFASTAHSQELIVAQNDHLHGNGVKLKVEAQLSHCLKRLH